MSSSRCPTAGGGTGTALTTAAYLAGDAIASSSEVSALLLTGRRLVEAVLSRLRI
ncbi:hypothetical protein [Streptomyces halobius]|uniref:hypothetical protein n=1 Tax=Streptomyces halobius TaxID=2879846 RepID=UPI00387317DF